MPRSRTTSWRAFRPDAAGAAGRRAGTIAARCRILGLDPGSRRMGYGILDCDGPAATHLAHGCIEVGGLVMALRLRRLFETVDTLVREYQPEEIAIERVFVHRNVESALKLGQARGAVLAAVGTGASVHEYAPREIKRAVVGFGGAEKRQIGHMISRLLGIEPGLATDAADALAVALCHANARRLRRLTALASS
jgi:crossover junction endodeoxyribonuclease RuvC